MKSSKRCEGCKNRDVEDSEELLTYGGTARGWNWWEILRIRARCGTTDLFWANTSSECRIVQPLHQFQNKTHGAQTTHFWISDISSEVGAQSLAAHAVHEPLVRRGCSLTSISTYSPYGAPAAGFFRHSLAEDCFSLSVFVEGLGLLPQRSHAFHFRRKSCAEATCPRPSKATAALADLRSIRGDVVEDILTSGRREISQMLAFARKRSRWLRELVVAFHSIISCKIDSRQ